MDWLTKIDPNTIIGLVGLLGTLATWTWNRLHGVKVDSFTDVITGLGKQAVHELLVDPAISINIDPATLSIKATAILNQLATKLGVPVNAITTAVIQATTQHVIGDVLTELRAATGLQDQLDQLNAQVSSYPALLAKTEADALAKGKKWAAENVEVMTDAGVSLPVATALPPK